MKPTYYQFPNNIETLDIAQHLTANGFAGVKYLTRSCRLDGNNKHPQILGRIKDLQKAKTHIEAEIERLRNLNQSKTDNRDADQPKIQQIKTRKCGDSTILDIVVNSNVSAVDAQKIAEAASMAIANGPMPASTPQAYLYLGGKKYYFSKLSTDALAALRNFLELAPIKD